MLDSNSMGNDVVPNLFCHSLNVINLIFQSAVGWDHIERVEKHDSQKDYKTGFGGKFGVQTDRVDKSAVGWEHIEKVEKHESQKGN
jgi:cortactin